MKSKRVVRRLAFGGLAIAAALFAVACTEPEDPPAVGQKGLYITMTRPPTVPLHFVATPNGWFDPACVHAVGEREKVLADGRVARADGSIRLPAVQCQSPRYDVQGNAILEGAEPVDAQGKAETPTVNGWIERVDSSALGALSYVHASWTVPSNPTDTGQVIYFFPGLEDSPVTRILQPVLGWNQAFGPAGWSMASWNCCVTGTTWHGPYVAALPNTTVQGDMTGTNCNSAGVCTNWSIVSYNAAGQGVALNTTVSTAMTWLFGHVLEAYSIDTCNELPGGTQSVASNFIFRTAPGGTTVGPPTWNRWIGGVSPQCNYQVTDTGATATLKWNVVVPVCTPGQSRSCCPFAVGCGCLGEQTCNSSGQWGVCEGAVKKPGVCQ